MPETRGIGHRTLNSAVTGRHHCRFGAVSDIGTVRRHNEDACYAPAGTELWIVADGMGGMAGGDVASQLAVEEISVGIGRGEAAAEAIAAAHEAIVAAPERDIGFPGMGTTVVLLRFDDHAYRVHWVGDSRAYMLRQGELFQLTRDHSLVQNLVDLGEITPEEAIRHPQRNVITRALGAPGMSRHAVDGVEGSVLDGDRFLLCTDGLTGDVGDGRIREILVGEEDPQGAAQALLKAALSAGGEDNITAIVVDVVI